MQSAVHPGSSLLITGLTLPTAPPLCHAQVGWALGACPDVHFDILSPSSYSEHPLVLKDITEQGF